MPIIRVSEIAVASVEKISKRVGDKSMSVIGSTLLPFIENLLEKIGKDGKLMIEKDGERIDIPLPFRYENREEIPAPSVVESQPQVILEA